MRFGFGLASLAVLILAAADPAQAADSSCGAPPAPAVKAGCPSRTVCARNADGSVVQVVTDQCPGAETHSLAFHYSPTPTTPPQKLTSLSDHSAREIDLGQRDPRGFVQIDLGGACGAGPNCEHELYRFDPAARAFYLFFSSGYATLEPFEGYLVEGGRSSCCEWEYHAYKIGQTGGRETVGELPEFTIVRATDGKRRTCRFSGPDDQSMAPPNPKWRKFCRED